MKKNLSDIIFFFKSKDQTNFIIEENNLFNYLKKKLIKIKNKFKISYIGSAYYHYFIYDQGNLF
jgi:hypothetical protein